MMRHDVMRSSSVYTLETERKVSASSPNSIGSRASLTAACLFSTTVKCT